MNVDSDYSEKMEDQSFSDTDSDDSCGSSSSGHSTINDSIETERQMEPNVSGFDL